MIRIIIALPFLFLLTVFALSNPQPVHLGLWPTDFVIELPLSLAILGGMAAAFVIGAFILWVPAIGARGRARRAERTVRRQNAEIEDLRAQLATAERYAGPPTITAATGRSTALALH